MKRSLTLLLASLLVVFGLTACGGSDNQNSETNKDSAVVGDSSADSGTDAEKDNPDGSAEEGTGQNGGNQDDSLMDDVQQGVDDAVKDTEKAVDDMTDNARTRSALVHDQDGDLKDHENSVLHNNN